MRKHFGLTGWLIIMVGLMIIISAPGCHKKPKFVDADLTVPVVSGIVVNTVTDQTATVSWVSSEPVMATIEFGPTTDYGFTMANNMAFTGGDFGLINLSPDTTYHFRIKVVDGGGNLVYSGDNNFTTNGPLTTILVTPSSVNLVAEETRLFTATGRDAQARPAVITPTWSVTNSIGTLSVSTGTVTAFTAGAVLAAGKVVATYGSVSGSADVAITGGVFPTPPEDGVIYKITTPDASSELLAEYDIGVNTSAGATNWLNENNSNWALTHDYFKVAYPGDAIWGAAFILVKPVKDFAHYTERNAYDFSGYSKLHLQIKGITGTEVVKIGVKDFNDADDGGETKVTVDTISTDWQTFEISLSQFPSGTRSNLRKLYVVIEFVWDSTGMNPLNPQTILVRDIKYVR